MKTEQTKNKKKTEFIIIKSGITLFRYIFLYKSYLRVIIRCYETKEDSLILALRAISQRVQLSKQATIGEEVRNRSINSIKRYD